MGVPIEVWRARIGACFVGLHRSRAKMATIAFGTAGSKGIRLTMAFLFFFVALPYLSHCSPPCKEHWPNLSNLLDVSPVQVQPRVFSRTGFWCGTAPTGENSSGVHSSFCAMELLLAGDVELNPGPGDTTQVCLDSCK